MKTMRKRTLTMLLVVLLLGDTAPLGALTLRASAKTIGEYKQGDLVTFGWYPQIEVTDSAMIASLNAATQTWQSYGYYSGTGMEDGQMTAKDYMQYCDVLLGGAKYRGVKFSQYRPRRTGGTSYSNNQYHIAYQYDNGYYTNTTYWFRYEPLEWRVLDPAAGLVLCEMIIDSQPYNSYALRSGTDAYGYIACWGDAGKTHYANNYAESSLRQWLNRDFYHAAFSPAQQAVIADTTLDNSAYSMSYSAYDSATTTDKVFLLSYSDVVNASYGFAASTRSPAERQAQGSDYAKCQGLVVYMSNKCSCWWLRSAGNYSDNACLVDNSGWVTPVVNLYITETDIGIRPALKLNLTSDIFQEDPEPLTQEIFIPKSPDFSTANTQRIEIPYFCDYLTNAHATVEWCNNLFSKPSTTYNKQVDMLGAALSAAAEEDHDTVGDGRYISNAYLYLGVHAPDISLFSYPDSSYNEKDAANEDGEKFATDKDLAFSIAYKKITPTGEDPYNLIFITARGTTTGEEAVFDAIQGESGTVLGYKTYDYYTDFFKDIKGGFRHFVEKHSELKNEKTKILVCGHSLGGAAANLMAAYLTKNLSLYSLQYEKKDVFGYTYGAVSPLVNTSTNVETGYENIFNTFNKIDTFGPAGSGLPEGIGIIGVGAKPKGSDNEKKKFGVMRFFTYYNQAYHDVSKKKNGLSTANHDMPGYLFAVACDFVEEQNYGSYHCPVDVEVKCNGKTVGRIKDNTIDETVTTIPCAVIGDTKTFVFDKDTPYDIVMTGTDAGSMKVIYGNTAAEGETKQFNDVALYMGKTLMTPIEEDEAIGDYTLHVTNTFGESVAEIKPDGSEFVTLFAPTVFHADADAEVDYLSQVTVTARAAGVPVGYYVALYDGETEIARGDNAAVTYTLDGYLKTDRTLTAKVVDAGGAVQKDADGRPLQCEARLTVKKTFFAKLVGILKSWFGIHSKKTIEM